MASDDWKPDYVELRMLGHAAQKGFQAGSLLGTAIGAPLVAWREGGVTPERVFRGAAYGAIGGFGLSVLMYLGKRATIDHDGVEERVYRLRHNRSQSRVDAFTNAGATAGLAAAAYLLRQGESGRHPPALGLAGGAAVGAALALLAHLATRPEDMRTPNRALDQLRN